MKRTLLAIGASAWLVTGVGAQECRSSGGSSPAAAAGGTLSIALPISGFSPDTQTDFKEAMDSVGREVYECGGHPDARSDEPGCSATCGGAELTGRRVAAFRSIGIQVSGSDQAALLELAAGETVHLSAITAALEGRPVSIDVARVGIGAGARLHLAGLTCGACSARVQAALAGLPGVEQATCDFGSAGSSLASLQPAPGRLISYETLERAVVDTGFRLADVSWTAPPLGRDGNGPGVRHSVGITGYRKRLGPEAELLIHGLVPGGVAERAGLRAGDRILTIDGHVAFEYGRDELEEVFGAPEPVVLAVQRGDETLEVTLKPEPLERSTSSARAGRTDEPRSEGALAAGPKIGRKAPEIDGEDLDGIPFKLSDYRGKVVLLDFWGFW